MTLSQARANHARYEYDLARAEVSGLNQAVLERFGGFASLAESMKRDPTSLAERADPEYYANRRAATKSNIAAGSTATKPVRQSPTPPNPVHELQQRILTEADLIRNATENARRPIPEGEYDALSYPYAKPLEPPTFRALNTQFVYTPDKAYQPRNVGAEFLTNSGAKITSIAYQIDGGLNNLYTSAFDKTASTVQEVITTLIDSSTAAKLNAAGGVLAIGLATTGVMAAGESGALSEAQAPAAQAAIVQQTPKIPMLPIIYEKPIAAKAGIVSPVANPIEEIPKPIEPNLFKQFGNFIEDKIAETRADITAANFMGEVSHYHLWHAMVWAADKTHIARDPVTSTAVMIALSGHESSLNPKAVAHDKKGKRTSSGEGLTQILDGTFENMVLLRWSYYKDDLREVISPQDSSMLDMIEASVREAHHRSDVFNERWAAAKTKKARKALGHFNFSNELNAIYHEKHTAAGKYAKEIPSSLKKAMSRARKIPEVSLRFGVGEVAQMIHNVSETNSLGFGPGGDANMMNFFGPGDAQRVQYAFRTNKKMHMGHLFAGNLAVLDKNHIDHKMTIEQFVHKFCDPINAEVAAIENHIRKDEALMAYIQANTRPHKYYNVAHTRVTSASVALAPSAG